MAWHRELSLQRWCHLQSSALFLHKWKGMGKSMKNRDVPAMRNALRACWNVLNSRWTKRPWFGVVFVVVCFLFFFFPDCYTFSQSAESHLSRVSSKTTKAKCACHIPWNTLTLTENRGAGPWALTYLTNTYTYQGEEPQKQQWRAFHAPKMFLQASIPNSLEARRLWTSSPQRKTVFYVKALGLFMLVFLYV